ncbi:MAG TPA: glutamate-1-semialdehyde 2,1-aminomutase [Nonomuraea sp.]|nr:glutamate-1-semialdehyde 2,1-aminomutase [Nonomuraea sp.]
MAVRSVPRWSSWEAATPRSKALFERAQRVLPGGVNSPVRGTSSFRPYPVYLERGDGAHVYDVDGNRYVDVIMGLGPVVLGHNEPSVVAAISEQAANGSVFATCTPLEVEVAEQFCRMVPSADLVRFTSSGTESTMHAMRLARGFTGKNKILKFEGHFHGNHDQVLLSVTPPLDRVGPAEAPARLPVGRGIPAEHYQHTLLAVWNDLDAVERVIREHRHDLAAVITEPVMANKGFIAPEPGFLQGLREITRANDVLLILDEVITGFRFAPGGAQEVYGVVPDLATFAKAMANGATIGAFAGRRDIMAMLGDMTVRHAGTYNAALVPLAAAKATLWRLTEDNNAAYDVLQARGRQLIDGLRAVIAATGEQAIVQGTASMLQLYFTPAERIRSFRETAGMDHERFMLFAHEMIARGVMIHPDPFEHWFLSTAHTDEDIDTVLAAAEDSLRALPRR